MKFFLSWIAIAALCLGVSAQGQTGIKHTKPKAAATAVPGGGPVTRAEAEAVLTRLRDMLADVLGVSSIKKQPISLTGTGTVTRDELVLQFDRLAEASKPAFKFSTPPQPVVPEALVTKRPEVKQAMTRLTKGGFVNRVGVLLSGPAESIDIPQFGDAVGYFLCRIAELSHTPSSKWSPSLMKPDQ